MTAQVLVTGGTGLIGQAVIRQLTAEGEVVRALVRDLGRSRLALPEGTEPVLADLRDSASLRRAIGNCHTIFHCAGLAEQWLPDTRAYGQTNTAGSVAFALAAMAADVARFVAVSHIDVFAADDAGVLRESQVDPTLKSGPYSRSMQRADALLEQLQWEGLPVSFVHPAAVFGPGPARPGSASNGLNRLISDLARGALRVLPDGGLPVVFVDDVARAVLAAAEQPIGSRYIVADRYVSTTELANEVPRLAGVDHLTRRISPQVAAAAAELSQTLSVVTGRQADLPREWVQRLRRYVTCDASLARRELSWTPTPFASALAKTVAHFTHAKPHWR